jgi:hypothetical protein
MQSKGIKQLGGIKQFSYLDDTYASAGGFDEIRESKSEMRTSVSLGQFLDRLPLFV